MRCKIFGIRFCASFVTVAVLSVAFILDTSYKIGACFLCALIHECGHLFAMRLFHIKPKSITLRFFEFVIDANTHTYDFSDMVITLFGPIFNLVFSLIFYPFSQTLSVTNLLIGLFNLLPFDTFDGGHALIILLTKKFSFEISCRIIKVVTFILLVPLFFVGIMVLFYSRYNYSLLLISLYLLTILFVK